MIYIKMQRLVAQWIINFLIVSFALGVSYYSGYRSAERKAENEKLQAEQQADDRFKRIQKQHSDSIAAYIESLHELQEQHESDISEIEMMKFAGAVDVAHEIVQKYIITDTDNHDNDSLHKCKNSDNRVRTTADKQDLLCFRKAEFQRKIKESLDITNECDKLVLKYNSLLKDCTAVTK